MRHWPPYIKEKCVACGNDIGVWADRSGKYPMHSWCANRLIAAALKTGIRVDWFRYHAVKLQPDDCRWCFGTGESYRGEMVQYGSKYRNKCETCNGTGKIEIGYTCRK